MPTRMPIIIHSNSAKTQECIIQDDRKYCEKVELSTKETGEVILTVVIFFTWLIWSTHKTLEGEAIGKVSLIGLPIIIAILMIALG